MKPSKTSERIRRAFLHRRSFIVSMVVVLTLGVGSFGCAGPTDQTQMAATPTKNLRTFEDVHVVEYKMPCQACHVSRNAPEYLRVEAGVVEFAPTNDRVTVDRKVCLSCHLSSKPIFGHKTIAAGAAY